MNREFKEIFKNRPRPRPRVVVGAICSYVYAREGGRFEYEPSREVWEILEIDGTCVVAIREAGWRTRVLSRNERGGRVPGRWPISRFSPLE